MSRHKIKFLLQKTPRRKAKIWEMNLEELKEKGLFMPPVEKGCLELPEPMCSVGMWPAKGAIEDFSMDPKTLGTFPQSQFPLFGRS